MDLGILKWLTNSFRYCKLTTVKFRNCHRVENAKHSLHIVRSEKMCIWVLFLLFVLWGDDYLSWNDCANGSIGTDFMDSLSI